MGYINQMVDMELDDEDKMDLAPPDIMVKPKYPPGLRIYLTEKEFDKLGLDHEEAEVGGMVHLHAMGRITSVSSNEVEGGDPNCRVEIQIEDLEIESEDEEDEEADAET